MEGEGTTCVSKVAKTGCSLLRFMARCLILSITLAIEFYFTKNFCVDYTEHALKEDINNDRRV